MKIKMETVISNMLRAGVISSAVITLIGGLIYLAGHAFSPVDYKVFHGASSEFRSVHGVIKGVLSLDSMAIIQLGVIVLIATPLARVVVTFFNFIQQRDRIYTIVTLIVLVILFYSLFG